MSDLFEEHLRRGKKVEEEHTKTLELVRAFGDVSLEEFAEYIARDHLYEHPEYYSYLERMELCMKKNIPVNKCFAHHA